MAGLGGVAGERGEGSIVRPRGAPIRQFRPRCGTTTPAAAAYKLCEINSSGSAVVDLICSMEKADETPLSWADLMSFL